MTMKMTVTILTIGHSNHDWPTFQRLLEIAAIQTIIDVRSFPTSRLAHFHGPALKERLAFHQIAYAYLGDQLGGRPREGGALDYEQMAKRAEFDEGVKRVIDISRNQRAALLCSEHEPLTCHRCLLVGRELARRGAEVAHVLRNGSIEAHKATEDRLLTLARSKTSDLFASREEELAKAYRAQAARLAKGSRSR
jgi:uncharacterized protein (DUF488 family)